MKRWFFIGAGFGVGVALTAAAIMGGIAWYGHRPKAWDMQAFEVTYTGIDTVQKHKVGQSDELDWLRFYYVVKNKTGQDYELEAGSAKLMAKLQDSGSLLHDPQLAAFTAIEYPLFIPAGQSIRLQVFVLSPHFDIVAPTDTKSKEYLEHRRKLLAVLTDSFSNLGGFVLFDNTHRYQITFPAGWIEKIKQQLEAKQ